MVAVRFIDLSKALWDTGVKNHLLRAAVRSLLWVCEKVIGGPRQAHADGSKCCEITWVEWGFCYSEWLYTVLASLLGEDKAGGGAKLERVKWNSGFLQNILLLWSLQMLRLVAFPLLCGMQGGEEAYGVCAGEGEAWKVVHLQDNCIGSWGGLPQIPGNLFCIWVHLVWTGEFPALFILDKRGTFLTLHWITDNKNNLHTLPFSLWISSDVLFVHVCPVLYLAFFLSCKQLCSLFFICLLHFSPLITFLYLYFPLSSFLYFAFSLSCLLPFRVIIWEGRGNL